MHFLKTINISQTTVLAFFFLTFAFIGSILRLAFAGATTFELPWGWYLISMQGSTTFWMLLVYIMNLTPSHSLTTNLRPSMLLKTLFVLSMMLLVWTSIVLISISYSINTIEQLESNQSFLSNSWVVHTISLGYLLGYTLLVKTWFRVQPETMVWNNNQLFFPGETLRHFKLIQSDPILITAQRTVTIKTDVTFSDGIATITALAQVSLDIAAQQRLNRRNLDLDQLHNEIVATLTNHLQTHSYRLTLLSFLKQKSLQWNLGTFEGGAFPFHWDGTFTAVVAE